MNKKKMSTNHKDIQEFIHIIFSFITERVTKHVFERMVKALDKHIRIHTCVVWRAVVLSAQVCTHIESVCNIFGTCISVFALMYTLTWIACTLVQRIDCTDTFSHTIEVTCNTLLFSVKQFGKKNSLK